MEVEKKTVNLWRLFFCCSSNCGYFKWSNVSPLQKSVSYECDSSGVFSATFVDNPVQFEDLSRIFKIFARISEEEDVKISINVTIREGKEMDRRDIIECILLHEATLIAEKKYIDWRQCGDIYCKYHSRKCPTTTYEINQIHRTIRPYFDMIHTANMTGNLRV
ncbi:Zinc finger protein [Forsythia ovata]|uniref:Zinc finger protein n=1 Tax=Forsythia ovata TaxID=205694 RepID=A0ABD1XC03_9LAMI